MIQEDGICHRFLLQPGDGGGGGGALNSLRNFRLQKKKFTAGTFDSDTSTDLIQSQSSGETDSPVKLPGGKRVLSDSSPSVDSSQVGTDETNQYQNKNLFIHQNGSSSVQSSQEVRPVHKRIRILSDSETEASPVKLDLPLAEDIEKKVSFLQNAYPDIDPMVLQDTLK